MRKKILSLCIVFVFVISLFLFTNTGNLFSETTEFRLPFVGTTTINTGSPYHTGVSSEALDFGLSYGQEVYAAGDGKVIPPTSYGINRGLGNLVKIEHPNGYTSIYAHLSEIVVSVGDNVKSGQLIGRVGNSGNVLPKPTSDNPQAGKHLHFEVRDLNNQSIKISDLMPGIDGLSATGPPLVYSILGYIYTSDGKSCFGLEGVEVEIQGIGKLRTDNKGIFRKDGLKQGTYIITPSEEGYSFNPSFKRVNLQNSINDLNFEATLLKINLAPNPSFESGANSPDGWYPYKGTFMYSEDGINYREISYKADLVWDRSRAYSGSCSISIRDLGGGHGVSWETTELIAVNTNIQYKISVWVKEETEWFTDYWEYPRKDREKIGIYNDIVVWIAISPYDSNGNYILNYDYLSSLYTSGQPSSNWSQIIATGYLPPKTSRVKIEIGAQEQTGYLHKNSVWFDDVYFGPNGS